MKEEFEHITLNQLPVFVQGIIPRILELKIVLLIGNLGAGKTTFSQEVLKQLGVVDSVSSPTFAIVNEYHSPKHGDIYHFDCYRLNNLEEALNIGFLEYIESGAICIIEWPEVVLDAIDEPFLAINIKPSEDKSRTFLLTQIEE